jgi:hypothetical protein
MPIAPKSLEPITVKVKFTRIYPQPARPGPAWHPNYSSFVPEVRLTPGNGLAENDHRDLPLYISEGSKAEFKRKTKLLLPNATIEWPNIPSYGRKAKS